MASNETPFGKDTIWSVALVYGEDNNVWTTTVVAESRDIAVLKAGNSLTESSRKTIKLVVAHPF